MHIDPKSIKTLVIKIGTNLLSGDEAFEGKVMENVVQEICALKKEYGHNVVLVSSGAIGCGMKSLGLAERPQSLPDKQAVAAVGQAQLMHYYEALFKTYGQGLATAQVLLTSSDLDERRTYLNARNTLLRLFEMGSVIPIVNENDTTAVDELRFSDNDTLAAKIAGKINADLLIILSDVDGLYDRNPHSHADARLITEVDSITPAIEALAGGPGSVSSTGGMRTKLEAAKIATSAGVPTVITNGHQEQVIHSVLAGGLERTVFAPAASGLSHRKRWIAFGRTMQGVIHVDDGARKALVGAGKSLLAAGITRVSGDFEVGDAVEIRDAAGQLIARALVNYASRDVERIQGLQSSEIAAVLGHKDFDEVAHRDNMVLLA